MPALLRFVSCLLILAMSASSALGAEALPYCQNNQPAQGSCDGCPETSETECPACNSNKTHSRVYNTNLSYMSDTTDYEVREAQGGCAPCGDSLSTVGIGALPNLRLKHIHRFWFQGFHNSFGPGVFSNFDTHLLLWPGTVRLMDPNLSLDYLFFNDAQGTGIYTNNGLYAFHDIRLYDGNGTLTGNQLGASTAVLTQHTGETQTFALFRLDGDPASTNLRGRLIRQADRNGNAVVLAYRFPASASDTALGGDRSKLWQIATITDAYGKQATVGYNAGTVGGEWVISDILLPNQSQVTYRYGSLNLANTPQLGLVGIDYPDGTHASFSTAQDPLMQCTVVTMQEAGAEGWHRNKSVWLTNNSWTDPVTGTVIAQAQCRARRVTGATGEVSYENRFWIAAGDWGRDETLIRTGGNELLHATFEGSKNSRVRRALTWDWTKAPETYTFEPNLKTYVYDGATRVNGTTDSLGRTTAYTVEQSNGAVNQVVYPDSSSSSKTVNAFRQPLRETDRLGRITDCVYDARGNLLSKTSAVGTSAQGQWTWTYNTRGQPLAATDADGYVTTYAYDANGYLASVTEPKDQASDSTQAATIFTRDSAGRLRTVTDAGGRTVTFTYDLRNRLVATAYADGSSEQVAYYGAGINANLVLSRSDRNGNVTTFAYDADGRETQRITAANVPTVALTRTTTYLTGTQLPLTVIENGKLTEYAYDYANRLVATTVHPTALTSLTYLTTFDLNQRVAVTTDPYGRRTFPVYDVNDRVIRTVRELTPGAIADGTNLAALARDPNPNPAYVLDASTYDAAGQTLTRTDARGNVTSYTYDARGRIVSQTEAVGTPVAASVQFQYDAVGNRTQVTDPRGVVSQMTYTGRNLMRTMTEAVGTPIAATTTYLYTPTRKVFTVTDALGRSTSNTYGVCCDRLAVVTDVAGFQTQFTYDSVGNRLTQTDPNGLVTAMTYDARHRLAAMTNGAGETTRMFYDENASDGIVWPGGSRPASADADLGLGAGAAGMAVITVDPLNKATIRISDGVGRTVRSIDANGNATTAGYDAVVAGLLETTATDALVHITRVRTDGAGRARLSLDAAGKQTTQQFDANGNRLRIRDPANVGMDCTFDARNRDTTCTDTRGAVTTKVYDANSNLVQVIDALNGVETTAYDARNRKTSTTDRINATTAFSYDLVGNLLRITDAQGGVTTYVYNARNLLVRETFPGPTGGTRLYSYDPGRRLVTRTDNLVTPPALLGGQP